MLTQCPGCQTVFRVTGAILRAAHGQVRCGRCNLQFDAINELLDTEEVADPVPGETVDEAPSHEDILLEGNRIEITGTYRLDEMNDEELAEHTHTIIEEFNMDSGEWEAPATDESREPSASSEQLAPEALEIEVDEALNAVSLDETLASLDPQQPTAPTQRTPTRPPQTAAPELEEFITLAAPQRTWAWALGGVLLSVLLLAQIAHHYRSDLARHPTFGPYLTAFYQRIGQPLTPQWQLGAYSTQQWGIVTDPQQPGVLRVRASVANGAAFAQPYPLLRLSLEDRFGGQVGQRDFKPEEYLQNPAQAPRLLEAGRSASIDLSIVDPGSDAVGFQFDTCLELPQGLRCSHAS